MHIPAQYISAIIDDRMREAEAARLARSTDVGQQPPRRRSRRRFAARLAAFTTLR